MGWDIIEFDIPASIKLLVIRTKLAEGVLFEGIADYVIGLSMDGLRCFCSVVD